MESKEALDERIDIRRNTIRTDKLDITFGELASMYEERELVIFPAYQRLFRWSSGQKAKFVESLLLGFPMPAIFVAEDDNGLWELIDGLQRVSTILEFLGVLKDPDNGAIPPSRVIFSEGKHLLPELNGFSFDDLTLRSKLSIKRAGCRVEVVKVGSAPKMKYELFERLNTGGSQLTHQEVRNCIFRAERADLMDYFDELALYRPYAKSLVTLSDFQRSSMYDRGLLLRFFALKDRLSDFDHDVEPFVTSYVRRIIDGEQPFDKDQQRRVFEETFEPLWNALEEDAWRHYRDGKHRGAFSVYVFESLALAVANNLAVVNDLSPEQLRDRCIALKADSEFINNTGSGANTRARMNARVAVANRIIRGE
jgi:hypothetical protein